MYFVALVCPPDIEKKVHAHKKWMKEHFGCVATMKSPAHLTMIKPFWLEDSWEDYLQKTLQSFETTRQVPDIQTWDFSHFGKRVLFIDVLHTQELIELKTQVEKHFIHSFGDSLKRDQLPFVPHITIANRDLKPGDFDEAWKTYSNKQFREVFPVKSISLLKLVDGKWTVISDRELAW
jgi:2'-5' RNA ligase